MIQRKQKHERIDVSTPDSQNKQDPAFSFLRADLLSLLVFTAIVFLLAIFAHAVNPIFEFNREAVISGQWWRLLTCNFVHLTVNHTLLNLGVFLLASLLFLRNVKLWHWWMVLSACCLSVGLGVLWFDSSVQTYVGLSGAVYGVLVFGLLRNVKENLWLYLAGYAYVHYKIYTQQGSDFDVNYLKDFIGGSVIASSHLFGVVMGNFLAFVFFLFPRLQRAIEKNNT